MKYMHVDRKCERASFQDFGRVTRVSILERLGVNIHVADIRMDATLGRYTYLIPCQQVVRVSYMSNSNLFTRSLAGPKFSYLSI